MKKENETKKGKCLSQYLAHGNVQKKNVKNIILGKYNFWSMWQAKTSSKQKFV